MRRILVANRGEIALRIIRACRDLGLEAVAVHSEADRGAVHVLAADAAVEIGAAPATESYLDSGKLIGAAREVGADGVHPGFGFLSENAEFAQAVVDAGLTWIGPAPDTIALMGSKTAARRAMIDAGVPVVPGFEGDGTESPETLGGEADRIGYPVLVKASAGGGGKGMRRVDDPADLVDAIEGARREAGSAFGDDRIYLERCLTGARHVEIQVFGDGEGNIVHLFERECSIQRRHQKIVEEAPSPALDEDLRTRMGDAAVLAARSVDYVGAGTVEFLLTPEGEFYFLEMNTRIQVEHAVTEMVTGLDLVALQIRVASGECLPVRQESLGRRGHAIECRVYAEDPFDGFLPRTGTVLALELPTGPGVRVDAGIAVGQEVGPHYDPMLAKIIAWGPTREEARCRMKRALGDWSLLGVPTNVAFLRSVLDHPSFVTGDTTTDFVAEHMADWRPDGPGIRRAVVAALLATPQTMSGATEPSGRSDPRPTPWRTLGPWRM